MAAAPQRPNPHEPEREPIVDTQLRVEREVGTGKPFSWAWVWIPIVVALFWFVGWGWGPWGGWWWGHGRTSATQSAHNAKVVQMPAQNPPAANNAPNPQTPPPGAPGSAGTPYRANGAAPAATVTGSGVAVLDAQDKSSFAGHSFQVSNVPVEKIASKEALWIGTSNTRTAGPLLAVFSGSAARALSGIAQGDRVNVSGTVEKAPPASQAEHNWKISSEDANNVRADGVYVRASQISRAQP